MNITNIAVYISIVPVDGQCLFRCLLCPLLPIFGLHLMSPGQQRRHLFTIPCAGFSVSRLCRLVSLENVAMHRTPDSKGLCLTIFHRNGFLTA
ncbi:Uncharacterised protein [Shigella sonnei]|nr:Uncharacterised protein [Shigella sonnei]CSP84099.1 Uncharacterised protein [Shigella sonnei]CSP93372.1 Uncharacterised protein [Shigella sonnei]CSP98335.1 Uncharacterised protein [Shigella sonnei]CSP99702.1 Uncharacterised protein [Shigella sonnei]